MKKKPAIKKRSGVVLPIDTYSLMDDPADRRMPEVRGGHGAAHGQERGTCRLGFLGLLQLPAVQRHCPDRMKDLLKCQK